MIALVQRVSEAAVKVEQSTKSRINAGLLVLVGIADNDDHQDIEWLSRKIIHMRIFNDDNGTMNLSLADIAGELLLISQFTLQASTKKGNRPSYLKAAKPEIAIPIYEALIHRLEGELGKKIQTGEFGADMKVSLVNDGPVSIIMDSKNKK